MGSPTENEPSTPLQKAADVTIRIAAGGVMLAGIGLSGTTVREDSVDGQKQNDGEAWKLIQQGIRTRTEAIHDIGCKDESYWFRPTSPWSDGSGKVYEHLTMNCNTPPHWLSGGTWEIDANNETVKRSLSHERMTFEY